MTIRIRQTSTGAAFDSGADDAFLAADNQQSLWAFRLCKSARPSAKRHLSPPTCTPAARRGGKQHVED